MPAKASTATVATSYSTIALTNPGGIRTDLRPRGPGGTVTYSDVYAVQPFGNPLVTLDSMEIFVPRPIEE